MNIFKTPLPATVLALTLGLASPLRAQVVPLPPPDAQGWIRLFRGSQDNANFYVFTTGRVPSQNRQTFPSGPFAIQSGDTIRASNASQGHFIHRQPFSHYRIRFQLRW